MKIFACIAIGFSLLAFSCFPDNMKEHMAEAMQKSQSMMVDMQFKTALHNIEMHKLRTGSYPDSLGQITFASDMDRSYFAGVNYTRWENHYELNLNVVPKGVQPYPDEFWKGLGCIKSNMMNPGAVIDPANADSTSQMDSMTVQ